MNAANTIPSVRRAREDDAAVYADHVKHHPTLHLTGRHGCWITCSCGWPSGLWRTGHGAHLAYGQHLVEAAQ